MKPTERLHQLGQSLWLDNITRPMLREGVLEGYIRDLSVTGLTSNPSIFEKAISSGEAYDEQIAELAPSAAAGEGVGANDQERIFFELALADLRDAADLFADVHRRTAGVDGFVSLEVSPLLADDAAATIEQAYQSVVPTGRHPVVVLRIQVPADEVDVNVHPQKLEVR